MHLGRRLCGTRGLQDQADSHFGSLNPRSIAQEVSKCDGFGDFITSIPVLVQRPDTIAKIGKSLLDALASEPGRLGARDQFTLLRDSPLFSAAGGLYITFELKNCDRVFRLR